MHWFLTCVTQTHTHARTPLLLFNFFSLVYSSIVATGFEFRMTVERERSNGEDHTILLLRCKTRNRRF